MRLKAVTGYEYRGTFHKQPPLMSGLGGHLREVVAYGKLIAIWLGTDRDFGLWSSGYFHCSSNWSNIRLLITKKAEW